jgi:hypothetical protein
MEINFMLLWAKPVLEQDGRKCEALPDESFRIGNKKIVPTTAHSSTVRKAWEEYQHIRRISWEGIILSPRLLLPV